MRVLVSGGGTGGHIYPALALINEIKRVNKDAQFLYIGTKKGLESKLVTREGIPFETIHITGFQRKISFENVKTIARFLKGVHRSKQLIKKFKPDVVVGTGGYVCGPVVYAAAKLNVPTIIHEQNSVPGLTNKFLSKYVSKVAISFPETSKSFPQEKVVYTGNPRATEAVMAKNVDRLTEIGLHKNNKTVLIVGGSRGAKPINDAFIAGIKEASKKSYQFLYVTGDIHYETICEQVKKYGDPQNVKVVPFIHNMPEVLKNVHVIVARAGATTLAEITALGLPSILIPSPYVTNNHQEKNARSLEKVGAAIVKKETELSGEIMLTMIDELLIDEKKWKNMSEAAEKLGKKDAALKLYELIETLISK